MKPFKNSLLILSIVILNLIFVDFFILSKNKVQEEQLTIEEKVEMLSKLTSSIVKDSIDLMVVSDSLIIELTDSIYNPNITHSRKLELIDLRDKVYINRIIQKYDKILNY